MGVINYGGDYYEDVLQDGRTSFLLIGSMNEPNEVHLLEEM